MICRKPPGPLTPKEEQATFRIADGFKIELVASEPDIVDPVAMCFDAKGRHLRLRDARLPQRRRRHRQRDTRQDQVPDRHGRRRRLRDVSHVRRGAALPDGHHARTRTGSSSRSPRTSSTSKTPTATARPTRRRCFTPVSISPTSSRWSTACNGGWTTGSTASRATTAARSRRRRSRMPPAVSLRNRGFRFKPDVPGSLEPTSGGGQYGLTRRRLSSTGSPRRTASTCGRSCCPITT